MPSAEETAINVVRPFSSCSAWLLPWSVPVDASLIFNAWLAEFTFTRVMVVPFVFNAAVRVATEFPSMDAFDILGNFKSPRAIP